MTTLVDTRAHFDTDIPLGSYLRIDGLEHDDPLVIYDFTTTTLTFARETWIARIIRWNPCNDLRMALGAW